MAHSRLEKIGTIYTRTRGLIQSGALNFNDRPIWFDLYEACPPKEEPRFDRPTPNIKIKEIFYEEDNIRAQLHKNVRGVGTVSLLNQRTSSFTQKFIDTYRTLETQYGAGQCEPEKLYNEAMDMLKKQRGTQVDVDALDGGTGDGALATAFRNAANQQRQTASSTVRAPEIASINVKHLFKD